MSQGIAPETLLEQVRATAAWALAPGYTQASYRDWILDAPRLQANDTWAQPGERLAYFKLLVAAHFTTCATFCPTDVDNRIRFHMWQELSQHDELTAAIAMVDEATQWPTAEVSARCIPLAGAMSAAGFGPDCNYITGHQGEWFTIYAGALGRVLQLGFADLAEQLQGRIDAELAREAAAMRTLAKARGREVDAIWTVASIAHNLGDLARVADAWPTKSGAAAALVARYTALPKQPVEPFGGVFVGVSEAYKDLCADSNHRYLALREAKCLRSDRALLSPCGPFFDAWGEALGRYPKFTDQDRASVLGALLAGHAASPTERGFLRALSGMNRTLRGGIDRYEGDVPARLRKVLRTGAVRPALDLDARRFEERMRTRFVNVFAAKLV